MLILIFTLWLLTSEHDKCYTNKEYEGAAAMNSCSVTAGKILAGAITADKIASKTITADNIKSYTIDQLAANSVEIGNSLCNDCPYCVRRIENE